MTIEDFLEGWNNASETVLVHTSGSTGEPKPMLVEKQRMVASARRTNDFLGLKKGDTALLCMSLDYIAGKMMVVRAIERGLQLVSVEPTGHPLSNQHFSSLISHFSFPLDFAAMVPMQVYNSLQVPEERERLMQIRHLIIGGGAIDEGLAAELKSFPNAVWSTYGMTETLSHIALRRLNGPDASEWYTPFPSVKVALNEEGCLVIDAPEVCSERLVTNDIAEVKQGDGSFVTSRDVTKEPSPCFTSAMSFVTSLSEHTSGASITRQPSSFRATFTEGKGVYHSEASGPFNLRRAIWESVSVIP